MILEYREFMLIETINKEVIKEHHKQWSFEKEIKIREKPS